MQHLCARLCNSRLIPFALLSASASKIKRKVSARESLSSLFLPQLSLNKRHSQYLVQCAGMQLGYRKRNARTRKVDSTKKHAHTTCIYTASSLRNKRETPSLSLSRSLTLYPSTAVAAAPVKRMNGWNRSDSRKEKRGRKQKKEMERGRRKRWRNWKRKKRERGKREMERHVHVDHSTFFRFMLQTAFSSGSSWLCFEVVACR